MRYITLTKIILDDGSVVPVGSVVSLNQSQAEYLIAKNAIKEEEQEAQLICKQTLADLGINYDLSFESKELDGVAKAFGLDVKSLKKDEKIKLLDNFFNKLDEGCTTNTFDNGDDSSISPLQPDTSEESLNNDNGVDNENVKQGYPQEGSQSPDNEEVLFLDPTQE